MNHKHKKLLIRAYKEMSLVEWLLVVSAVFLIITVSSAILNSGNRAAAKLAERVETIKKAEFLCKDRKGVRHVKFNTFPSDFGVKCRDQSTFHMNDSDHIGGYVESNRKR